MYQSTTNVQKVKISCTTPTRYLYIINKSVTTHVSIIILKYYYSAFYIVVFPGFRSGTQLYTGLPDY